MLDLSTARGRHVLDGLSRRSEGADTRSDRRVHPNPLRCGLVKAETSRFSVSGAHGLASRGNWLGRLRDDAFLNPGCSASLDL